MLWVILGDLWIYQDIMISELPDELILSSIIEPLANPVRFSMIKTLSNGSMSFWS
jgi:hypothetical protein